ncbi:MAG: YHS domain-containing protein [Acidobacteriota bacterium]|nr:YHS domain-containing protein [Acidobacteriota bacterium]MDQ5870986.1 YHS domain-containing protein [Acidobacteriota bacterium]
MIRKTWLSILTAVVFVLATAALAGAGGKKTDKATGDMSGCAEHHSAAMKASEQVNIHLADAKRSGTIAEMRRHVELAQTSMAEMEKHASMCMEMMHKPHGDMEGHHKGTMGGTMSDKSASPHAKVADPVCGMEVDPATAPTAIHAGKTYYFCSDEEKAKFQKNPEQYVRKSS